LYLQETCNGTGGVTSPCKPLNLQQHQALWQPLQPQREINHQIAAWELFAAYCASPVLKAHSAMLSRDPGHMYSVWRHIGPQGTQFRDAISSCPRSPDRITRPDYIWKCNAGPTQRRDDGKTESTMHHVDPGYATRTTLTKPM
jgi:hypothetical protein